MNRGEERSTIGVIFDLDGTLADTLDDIVDSINHVYRQIGQPSVPHETVRPFIGIGLVDLVRRTSGIDDTETILGLVDQYRSVYTERMLRKTRLYAGMDSVLDLLTELDVPACVLSNKPHEYTAPICESLLSRWPFVRCVGCAEQEKRKPDPAVAFELAREMGRDPSRVYLVGDSPIDIATAHNAGMTSIAVTWGYGNQAEIRASKPACMVDRTGELITFFREACHTPG